MNQDIQKENEKLRAEATELAKKYEALQAELSTAKPNKVNGKFTAKWETPMGEEKTRTFGFADGYINQWMNGYKVPTADIISIANGKKVPEKVTEAFPWLNKENAAAFLTNLAMIGAGCLVDVE